MNQAIDCGWVDGIIPLEWVSWVGLGGDWMALIISTTFYLVVHIVRNVFVYLWIFTSERMNECISVFGAHFGAQIHIEITALRQIGGRREERMAEHIQYATQHRFVHDLTNAPSPSHPLRHPFVSRSLPIEFIQFLFYLFVVQNANFPEKAMSSYSYRVRGLLVNITV